MIKIIAIIFLCAFVELGKADYCQENFTLSEFPEGILKEAVSLIIKGTIEDFKGCPENSSEVPAKDVKFWFYNRSNPDVPILLDPQNASQITADKPLKLLIPGWLCNVTNDRMPELRKAYLNRYDCNVVGIDWTAISIALYTESFCGIPGVAKIVAAFLCKLNADFKVDLSTVHVLGHSMGGQIAGLTGQEVQKQCNKLIGQITGMDPAGPLYQTLPKSRRLSKDDAAFVQVIHTNQAFLGFFGPCGQADFFPNCGTFQPGCMRIDNTTSVSDIINLPVSVAACNHLRSCDYMIESINNSSGKTFTAKSCKECPGLPIIGPCIHDWFFPKCAVMGEDCPRISEATKFDLETNSEPPFAKGKKCKGTLK